MNNDPFRHHPGLRELIRDPLTSLFRDFDAHSFMASVPDIDASKFLLSKEDIEAARRAFLSSRPDGDLWVFAYGSLMWDPAFQFAEVRKGFAPSFGRRFILKDTFGARGTSDRPGLMAALDHGPGCHGLVFRVDEHRIEEETPHIWARERAGLAYQEALIGVETDHGQVQALTFVADHSAETIWPELLWAEKVAFAATGEGKVGTSMEYLENLASQFSVLGIEDTEVTDLLEAARAAGTTDTNQSAEPSG